MDAHVRVLLPFFFFLQPLPGLFSNAADLPGAQPGTLGEIGMDLLQRELRDLFADDKGVLGVAELELRLKTSAPGADVQTPTAGTGSTPGSKRSSVQIDGKIEQSRAEQLQAEGITPMPRLDFDEALETDGMSAPRSDAAPLNISDSHGPSQSTEMSTNQACDEADRPGAGEKNANKPVSLTATIEADAASTTSSLQAEKAAPVDRPRTPEGWVSVNATIQDPAAGRTRVQFTTETLGGSGKRSKGSSVGSTSTPGSALRSPAEDPLQRQQMIEKLHEAIRAIGFALYFPQYLPAMVFSHVGVRQWWMAVVHCVAFLSPRPERCVILFFLFSLFSVLPL